MTGRHPCLGKNPPENAEIVLVASLKACTAEKDLSHGVQLHANILKQGSLKKNVFIGSALISMYAKLGALAKARQVFDELSVRNRVSWTALITGYIQEGHSEDAIAYYEWMRHEGLSPDAVTLACILKACGSIGATEKGKEIHDEILKRGFLGKDNVLGTALVDMYAKCGVLLKAQEVFDQLRSSDVVAWTALITGYCLHGYGEEALDCFEKMRRSGAFPNALTFASALKACGKTGAAEKGREIHVEIVRDGLLGKDRVLGSVLVDMYAKCGALVEAREILEKLTVRDVVSWTGLIEGYCQQGYGEEALGCFERMKVEGLSPDLVIFGSILKACSSIGSVEKGQLYFESVSTRYGIAPTLEHHTCLVGLFGHFGQFDNVMAAMKKMPSINYPPVWFALMGACQKWGNVQLGKLAFDQALRLDVKSAISYVRMSNIYAAAGMQAEADQVEALRRKNKCRRWRGNVADCMSRDTLDMLYSYGQDMHNTGSGNIFSRDDHLVIRRHVESCFPLVQCMLQVSDKTLAFLVIQKSHSEHCEFLGRM